MEKAQPNKTGIDFDRVRAAIEPLLRAHGLVLVDLEWGTERSGWVLRVFIERETFRNFKDAHGGVTLDDCATVSRDLSSALDIADLIRHHYHLEVSSPGLDRKLFSRSDFERFEGETAKVKLRRAAPDGQRVLRGTLVPAPGHAPKNHVALMVDGKLISVPFEDVEEARLVFELLPQPKNKSGKGKLKAARPKGEANTKAPRGAEGVVEDKPEPKNERARKRKHKA